MRFLPTPLAGVMVIEQQPIRDDRGAFSRTFCRDEFTAAGLDFQPAQESLSLNRARHTLRGLHFQRAPHEEQKLVRCQRGAIFDVVVDLRANSPTFGSWAGVELTDENRNVMCMYRAAAATRSSPWSTTPSSSTPPARRTAARPSAECDGTTRRLRSSGPGSQA